MAFFRIMIGDNEDYIQIGAVEIPKDIRWPVYDAAKALFSRYLHENKTKSGKGFVAWLSEQPGFEVDWESYPED